jgi:hypothetical protein
MPDYPLPRGRAGSVGGRLHHQPGDVLAGPRPRARLFQLEDLTAVDRERLDLDQGLARPGLGQAGIGEADQRVRPAGGNEGFHVSQQTGAHAGGPTALGLG